jgi:phosphohistidine phosphatase
MRTLYLLRHAQAATPQGVEDKHRPLTQQGLADALALGRLMKAKGYKPDFIICSPARRTQQTMRKVLESLGEIKTVMPQAAYYTTTGQLYDMLKTVDGNIQNLMLISHNPSIHSLVRFLAGLGTDESILRLNTEYQECTLSVLECPIDGWATLMPTENDLADLLVPGRDFTAKI